MSSLEPYQVEQIKEIGASLQERRQEKGLTLDEIKVKTYIPLRILQALEQAQVHELPEPVFIQGLIRRYADVLGLDGKSLSQAFSVPSSFTPPSLELSSPRSAANRSLKLNLPRFEFQNPLIWIVPGALALSLIGIALLPNIRASLARLGNRPARTASQAVPSPTVPRPGPDSAPIAKADSEVRVQIKLTSDSWMDIRVDGKKTFEGVLPEGSERTWTAKERVAMEVGNAGAVMVSVNGKTPKKLGNSGEVRRVSFKPERLNPSKL
ncbi:MAG: DUF4115 domain-containing protein [Leptolyngbyaceae cyanobacterium bins.59]|nr:DUF4115 domain-containing protein [Leptolyngbyaceae cyanobacterium bins.59]